ncbi:MAG: hypothetical protein ACRDQZ_03110 [Mycobacteriales bacterium]
MSEPKTYREMLGDYYREASLLLLIFGVLDGIFDTSKLRSSMDLSIPFLSATAGKTYDGIWYGSVLLLSTALLWLGMLMERGR